MAYPNLNPTFANYNSYNSVGVSSSPVQIYLMNQTYELSGNNEANLLNGISSEWYYLYGTDMNFMPREVNLEETTFGEYLSSTIERGIPIRMFMEETSLWSGNGDMYSKFGLQVTDECTLWCTKSFFSEQTSGLFPKQGDLIYVGKSHKLFQISHVEDEISPSFYLLGNRNGYKIQCKMFAYNHEAISQSASAGIPSAVQALDGLLNDLEGNVVTLSDKEFNQNNSKIIDSAVPIINNVEDDPLG
jgi:hypothetical protein